MQILECIAIHVHVATQQRSALCSTFLFGGTFQVHGGICTCATDVTVSTPWRLPVCCAKQQVDTGGVYGANPVTPTSPKQQRFS